MKIVVYVNGHMVLEKGLIDAVVDAPICDERYDVDTGCYVYEKTNRMAKVKIIRDSQIVEKVSEKVEG